MTVRYFGFFGKLARVVVDHDDIPVRCEVFDNEQGALVRRDDLTVDVINTHGSRLISESEFEVLLARVRGKRG